VSVKAHEVRHPATRKAEYLRRIRLSVRAVHTQPGVEVQLEVVDGYGSCRPHVNTAKHWINEL
jgi:hypothetical protein